MTDNRLQCTQEIDGLSRDNVMFLATAAVNGRIHHDRGKKRERNIFNKLKVH
jgi:hypothetical protein